MLRFLKNQKIANFLEMKIVECLRKQIVGLQKKFELWNQFIECERSKKKSSTLQSPT